MSQSETGNTGEHGEVFITPEMLASASEQLYKGRAARASLKQARQDRRAAKQAQLDAEAAERTRLYKQREAADREDFNAGIIRRLDGSIMGTIRAVNSGTTEFTFGRGKS